MGEFTPAKFLAELKRWEISVAYSNGRIYLSGDYEEPVEHYKKFLKAYPGYEASVILKLAEQNPDIMDSLEERAAIREADGLQSDLNSAALCNIN